MRSGKIDGRLVWAVVVAAFALSLATAAMAAVVVIRQGEGTHQTADAAASLTLRKADAAKGHAEKSPLKIDVRARHRGNLVLDLTARLSVQEDALAKAKVMAYLDMKQMPGAHLKGPIPLRELAAKPGTYRGRATVDMVGDYDVRVVSLGPVRGEAKTQVSVGVL